MKFKYLPELKSGVGFNNLFCVGNKVYDLLGFCNGEKRVADRHSRQKMIRGFKTEINVFDLKTPEIGWRTIGRINLSPRMCAFGFSYQNEIYIWGGFGYTPLTEQELTKMDKLPPKTNVYNYSDGVKLIFGSDDEITQIPLPNLPYECCLSSAVVVGHTAYFLGGCHYVKGHGYCCRYQVDDLPPVGKIFFSLDLENLSAGFQLINNYPGSPICTNNLIAYQETTIYVLGGKSSVKDDFVEKNGLEYRPLNVIDNWKYDIESNTWQQLVNRPPVNIVNYTAIGVADQIYLFGGIKYFKTLLPDGSIVDSDQLTTNKVKLQYGGVSDIKTRIYNDTRLVISKGGYLSNLIIKYDIPQDKFTLLPTRLPANLVSPSMTIGPNQLIYLGGGEANLSKNDKRDWTLHPYHFIEIDLSD